MKICLEKEFDELKKPIVKNHLVWNMGVYKDSTAQDPEIEFNLNKNTELKLLTVVAVSAVVITSVCVCRKIARMMNASK